MQAIDDPAPLPHGYILGPVSTVALRGTIHAVQLYQQPPSVTAGSFGASKLFFIELEQCIALFKEAFPPENVLWRKLPPEVDKKGNAAYDQRLEKATRPYFKNLAQRLTLRMEAPQSVEFISLVGLAQVAACADEVCKNIRQGYERGAFEAGPESLLDEDLLAFDAFQQFLLVSCATAGLVAPLPLVQGSAPAPLPKPGSRDARKPMPPTTSDTQKAYALAHTFVLIPPHHSFDNFGCSTPTQYMRLKLFTLDDFKKCYRVLRIIGKKAIDPSEELIPDDSFLSTKKVWRAVVGKILSDNQKWVPGRIIQEPPGPSKRQRDSRKNNNKRGRKSRRRRRR